MHRILPLLLLLAWVLTAALADQPADNDGHARTIAPYLDEQVIAVARIDVMRLNTQAIADLLDRLRPGDPEDQAAFRQTLIDWAAKFTKSGGRELYAVISLADLPQEPPFVILPLDANADAKALAELLQARPTNGRMKGPLEFEVSEKMGQVIFAGSKRTRERLRSLKAALRPELAVAFAAAGNASLQMLLLPSTDVRRVVEETLPPLPFAPVADGSKTLSHGIRWAASGLDGPPRMSLRLVIQSDDAEAAKKLRDWLAAALKALGQDPDVRGWLSDVERLAAPLTPEVAGDRLTLSVDDATLAAVLTPLVGKFGQAVSRENAFKALKQIGLAMHNYHDVYKHFPTAANYDNKGRPLLSWRVHILPYLDEDKLYKEFHLDEPWDSEHNKPLSARMPAVYRTSSKLRTGMTTLLGVAGERAMFSGRRELTIRDVPDGTSNTIWVVDADLDRAVVWTKPDDLTYDRDKPTLGLGNRYSGGFAVLFVDASARFIPKTIDPKTLAALFTRNGGEVVNLP
jgi:hypothetical protein